MSDRNRSYQWQDPRPTWASIGSMSGLEFLQREIRGEAPPPPICISMGFELVAASETEVVYHGQPGEDHYNAVGGVQGGWLASLFDAALGSVVFASLPPGARYTTLDLKVNFVRAVTLEIGPLTCTANLLHGGRRLGTAEAKITDAEGKLYAHGSSTCMIFQGVD